MRYGTWGRGVAWTALGTVLAVTPVWAQEGSDVDEPTGSRGVEVMTVTAQRTEESLLDVPIAVTSLDAESLDARQIETFSDIQFNTPNLSFTKGNFTGSNLQIRGIGSTLVATSADTGASIHVNNIFLQSPRLFETEFFDVQRAEILRGPQGTLFGRNATGGVVNVITARPELEDFGFNVNAEYGNFDHIRVKGHVNIPIVENVLGVRVAGLYLQRDGYSENIFNGQDVDGRDQFAIRGSIRWTPSERTTLDIVASYYEEDSDRVRSAKQLCNRDPSGVLGCLPDTLEFETTNGNSTLAGVLTSDLVLGPLGLQPFFGPGGGANAFNPPDLRQVNLDFQPIYNSDETFVMVSFIQDLTDTLTFYVEGGYQNTLVSSNQDYNSIFSNEPAVLPAAFPVAFPNAFAALYSDGLFPISAVDDTNTGVVGGNILSRDAFLEGYDRSSADSEQFSIEGRLQSNYEGPLNFLLGVYYLDFETETNYNVVANQLDYFSVVGAGVDGLGLVAPYFNSETDRYQLKSLAFFGEAYYDLTETLSVTGGIRYTIDDKRLRDRQLLLDTAVPLGTPDASGALAGVDKDPLTPGIQEFREADVTFQEVTGRFVVQWQPEVSFTDSTTIYFSYSRGFKSGGINPPIDPALFPGTESNFAPEFVNAYEIGTKNALFDNRLQASLTGFYYDYTGLQVSRIVNRTSVNDNIDARIWGIEGEFFAVPTDNWQFNLSMSYLNTSIIESAIVDGRDPTQGSADVTLIKDISNAANCVVEHNGAGDLISSGAADALNAAGIPFIPAATPGIAFAGFGVCEALQAGFGALGLPYTVSDGVAADLDGNELQNSPNFTMNIGGQYTHFFEVNGTELSLESRVDYYYQTSFFARIYNRPIDEIDAYGNLNLQMTLYGPDRDWYLRGFVQNLANSDQITGHYFTDPSAGNFTNVFVLEPRLYGVEVGYTF